MQGNAGPPPALPLLESNWCKEMQDHLQLFLYWKATDARKCRTTSSSSSICWKLKSIGVTITNAQHKMHFALLILQLLKFWRTQFETAKPCSLKQINIYWAKKCQTLAVCTLVGMVLDTKTKLVGGLHRAI
jgi:hypothetical protein